jgi:hypothetical protein
VQGQGFQVESAGVQPHFFDINEDTPSVPRQWCLEVGDVETDVSDNFAFDQAARRVGHSSCKAGLPLHASRGKHYCTGTCLCVTCAHDLNAQVTFVSPDGIWAVRFGNAAQYAAFTEQYNDKLFENTFKVDNDEANRSKVTSS